MAVLVAVVALNALAAATDGTGSPSVSGSFPRATGVRVIPKQGKDGAGASEGERSIDVTLDDEGVVTVRLPGGHIRNRMYKEKVEKGLTSYFTHSSDPPGDDSGSRGEGGHYYAVRFIQSDALGGGDLPASWACVLYDRTAETVWSCWFTLEGDGTAEYGSGPIDYAEAGEGRVLQYQRSGKWSAEVARDGWAVAIEDDENAYSLYIDGTTEGE